MINQEQLDAYRKRFEEIKKKIPSKLKDWDEIVYQDYPELVVSLIYNLQEFIDNQSTQLSKEEIPNQNTQVSWADYRDYKFKIYLDAERNTLVGEVLVGDEVDARGFESNSLDCLIERLERHSDEQSSYKYQNQLAKENIQLQDRIKELKREIERLKTKTILPEGYFKEEQSPEAAQRLLETIERVNEVNKKNYKSQYSKIIATVYWWTKEPEDEFVDEENITEKLDEELLESLGLRYGSNLLTTINQIDYVSELIESKIDVEEYDYFFEYHGDK